MTTYHVIVISGDRINDYDAEPLGKMLKAVVRVSGQGQERVMAGFYGIQYLASGMEFHTALENAIRDYL